MGVAEAAIGSLRRGSSNSLPRRQWALPRRQLGLEGHGLKIYFGWLGRKKHVCWGFKRQKNWGNCTSELAGVAGSGKSVGRGNCLLNQYSVC
jgi:hypothetical protein